MLGRGVRRGLQIMMMICIAFAATRLWVGCAPQERYHALTFFFDGVPDPNAPPKPKRVRGQVALAAGAGQTTAAVGLFSHHPPYVKNQCASCHPMNWGANNGQFAIPIAELCVKCHPKVPAQYAKMHGPVAVKACDWCHDPHESSEPHLFKAPARKVCVQCHDPNLLSSFPIQHVDGTTSCVECHSGHGGPKRYFLNPAPAGTQPGTQPATQPATSQPATGEPATTLPDSTQPATPAAPEPSPPRRPAVKELL